MFLLKSKAVSRAACVGSKGVPNSSLNEFESELASTLGKEASLFCVSGVMAQQIALRVHMGPTSAEVALSKRKVLVHHSSHLLHHEEGAPGILMGIHCVPVGDVSAALSLDALQSYESAFGLSDVFAVVIELGQRYNGGALPSWEELVAMSEWCRARRVALHMDGARLWEAAPHFEATAGVSLPQIAGVLCCDG